MRRFFIYLAATLISLFLVYWTMETVRRYVNAIYGTPPASKTWVTPVVVK